MLSGFSEIYAWYFSKSNYLLVNSNFFAFLHLICTTEQIKKKTSFSTGPWDREFVTPCLFLLGSLKVDVWDQKQIVLCVSQKLKQTSGKSTESPT